MLKEKCYLCKKKEASMGKSENYIRFDWAIKHMLRELRTPYTAIKRTVLSEPSSTHIRLLSER